MFLWCLFKNHFAELAGITVCLWRQPNAVTLEALVFLDPVVDSWQAHVDWLFIFIATGHGQLYLQLLTALMFEVS